MLSDIRRFLMSRSLVSLYELASRFDVEEGVMAGMLSHWLRKGMVLRSSAPCEKACGGCDRVNDGEWYQWVQSDVNRATGLISVMCCDDR